MQTSLLIAAIAVVRDHGILGASVSRRQTDGRGRQPRRRANLRYGTSESIGWFAPPGWSVRETSTDRLLPGRRPGSIESHDARRASPAATMTRETGAAAWHRLGLLACPIQAQHQRGAGS